MTNTILSVPDLLDGAARLIEAEGHWRGGSDLGGHDILSAIEAQTTGLEMSEAEFLRGECETELSRFLGWPETSGDLYRWNDGASQRVVVQTLRRCALYAEARTSQDGAA